MMPGMISWTILIYGRIMISSAYINEIGRMVTRAKKGEPYEMGR